MRSLHKMNLNYLFNKAYYEPLTHENAGKCNDALTGRRFISGKEEIPFSKDGFCMKTSYPGLLIGVGYTHEAGSLVDGKDEEGAEIKLGFTLDFVTGMPYIPASTVKGVLRSAFRWHPEFVAELLEINPDTVADVEKAVFEEGAGKVVFFDAVSVKAGKGDRILGLDNITPHGSPLKDPNPITMLKIIPNVVFLFRFDFSRWKETCDVTADALKGVFIEILSTLGIGAKTNVGYGAMELAEIATEFKYLVQSDRRPTSAHPTADTNPREEMQPRAPEGKCQWEGCNKDTLPRAAEKGGGFQPYCKEHYMEVQKKKNRGGAR